MTDLVLALIAPVAFALGWVLRGMKEMRDQQAVTHELFRRADRHRILATTIGHDFYLEMGRAESCVDAAALVAGIETSGQDARAPLEG
jgi:hypothetical protein